MNDTDKVIWKTILVVTSNQEDLENLKSFDNQTKATMSRNILWAIKNEVRKARAAEPDWNDNAVDYARRFGI